MPPPAEPLHSIDHALATTERNGEVFAAIARILIAAAMLLAAWQSKTAGPAGQPLIMVSLLYTAVSATGLGLALARVFHPSLPYMYVFVDALAIALGLTMLARMHELDLAHEFSLPLFSLAFVVLIHAALRYRPALVLFGSGTFIGLLIILPEMLPTHSVALPDAGSPGISDAKATKTLSPHDIGFIPLVFLLLGTFLLYYIVQRTRSLAELALLDGRRAAQLSRFFSPEVANRLAMADDRGYPRGRRQNAAIVFVDIRDFSRLSEAMSPEAVTELLASFRNRVCQVVFEHGGTIDKFIGDAVLIVFGTPEVQDDDAEKAVRTVFAICREISDWSRERRAAGLTAASVGIGAHYGELFAGVIETGLILEHSVIGETVNVAQRFERLTRTLSTDIVLSERILVAAGVPAEEYSLKRKADISIPGHSSRFTIYHT